MQCCFKINGLAPLYKETELYTLKMILASAAG
jgi:hypothetical protein